MDYFHHKELNDFYAKHGDEGACIFCQKEDTCEVFYAPLYYLDCGVCSDCLKKLWAMYNYRHSGEYGGVYESPRGTRVKKRPKISRMMAARVFARDGVKCRNCGATEKLEVDHIIPLSKGGEHKETNMACLCKSCNCKKGTRI